MKLAEVLRNDPLRIDRGITLTQLARDAHRLATEGIDGAADLASFLQAAADLPDIADQGPD